MKAERAIEILEFINRRATDYLDCMDIRKATRMAINALGNAPDINVGNEWIPVSEKLPEEDKKAEYYDSVIVTLDNGRVAEGCYRNMDREWWVDAPDGEHFSEDMTGHVLAWMPLPEPYKGD